MSRNNNQQTEKQNIEEKNPFSNYAEAMCEVSRFWTGERTEATGTIGWIYSHVKDKEIKRIKPTTEES